MAIPRFIQISTLTSYSAALLNRDDAGLAKRVRFGGAVRTRVSSQCLKRHWRTAEDEHALSKVDPSLTLSIRSREVFPRRIAPALIETGFPEAAVTRVLSGFIETLYGKSKATDGESSLSRKEVIVLGLPEVEFITREARSILEKCESFEDEKKTAKELDAAAKDYFRNADVKKNWHALACGAGLDAAMFGRFISGDPEARVSAAVHVAHALTVHGEAAETDYFTAVDDLTTSSEGGSGHLGAAELTSGVFYTYAVMDVPQLVSNITGARPEQWLETDRTLVARTVEHLLHLMAKVSPGAKLGATAPYDHAGMVLVETGERQPRSLVNAFLAPVSLEGDAFRSGVDRLGEYLESMDGMYGREEDRWLASRVDAAGFDSCTRCTFPELVKSVADAIAKGA